MSKAVRDDQIIDVEHEKPLVFGKDHDKGLIWDGHGLRAVQLGVEDPVLGRVLTVDDLIVWDARDPNPTVAFALCQLVEGVDPTPIGLLRAVPETTPYEELVHGQIDAARTKNGERGIKDLLYTGNTWEVG